MGIRSIFRGVDPKTRDKREERRMQRSSELFAKKVSCLFALSILMKLNPEAEYVDAYPWEIKANSNMLRTWGRREKDMGWEEG